MSTDLNVIAENLTELLQNSVNMASVFYDIFLNPEPMDVELKQFNSDNELVTISLPNRAKDRMIALTGAVTPEGNVEANVGASYVCTDPENPTVWFKVSGSGNTGWQVVLTEEGIVQEIIRFLSEANYVTESSLGTYLTTNGYATEDYVQEQISEWEPAISMQDINDQAGQGTISLNDNKGF